MELKHTIPTLDEFRSYRKPIHKSRNQYVQSLTWVEKFAVVLHHQVGSMGFFFLLFFWSVGWLAWNIFAPMHLRFDPAPAFVIWLFASNIIQLILLPVIMVGQNIEGRAAEWRAQKDFEVNQRSEEAIEVVLGHLENQNEMMLEIMRKVESK